MGFGVFSTRAKTGRDTNSGCLAVLSTDKALINAVAKACVPMGVTLIEAQNPHKLVKSLIVTSADAALYRAKSMGRNALAVSGS